MNYRVIGLMSGTSLDGLDIAYCHFKKLEGQWLFELKASKSIGYSSEFKARLKKSIELPAIALLLFHNEYGQWMGMKAADFIGDNQLEVDFLASHGHTVFHQPDKGLTYQIGSGQHLANAAGKKVICDFRTNDVALGGQGAPLVPIGDELLFSKYDLCLNLGGISNVSFKRDGNRIAYDISPANMLLNHIIQKIGKPYDDKGRLARTGHIDQILLDQLNALEYYKQPIPKSLGYEWFSDQVIPLIDNNGQKIEDLLCTAVHHISEQIATSLLKEAPKNAQKLLVTGGGAKNDFLIETISQKLGKSIKVHIPEASIIDYKEAIVFAFIGVLRERNEVNCLRSVTGALSDSSGGVTYHPNN